MASYRKETVKAKAKGRWVEILRGAGLTPRQLDGKNQPCPGCGGTDRFRFTNYHKNGDYVCNQCGNGDGFQLLQIALNISFAEALEKVGAYLNAEPIPDKETYDAESAARARDEYKPILPVPDDAPPLFKPGSDWFEAWNPGKKKISKIKAVLRHEYRDAQGRLLGYCIRMVLKDGKKLTPIITYCERPGGAGRGWAMRAFDEPAPLYGLDQLEKPGNVLIFEGEKTVDAARRLLPDVPIVGWPGGTNRHVQADWTPLHGRKALGFPDNDPTGLAVYTGRLDNNARLKPGIWHLLDGKAKIKLVRPPSYQAGKWDFTEFKEGWDAADAESEGWDTARMMEYIRANVIPLEPQGEPAPKKEEAQLPPDPVPEPEDTQRKPLGGAYISVADQIDANVAAQEPENYEGPGPEEEGPPAHHYEVPPPEEAKTKEDIIRPLGVDGESFYYFPADQLQIRRLSSGAHIKNNLLSLAPLDFWELGFPGGGQDGVEWNAAVNWLMRRCKARGIFNPDNVRGRGCWKEGEKTVIHLGNRLLVDGQAYKIDEWKTRHIYQQEANISEPHEKPLELREAKKIAEAARLIKWEVPSHAALFVGWLALSFICGALRWRPHIWIIGKPGSGKTTVLRDFLAALLQGFALRVKGNTTEAGLRQRLKADAIPVVFDEAGNQQEKFNPEIQKILELMRASSTDDDFDTLKGSAGHNAVTYKIRSMFCLSNVVDAVKQKADSDRISMLSLRSIAPKNDAERAQRQHEWEALKQLLAQFNADFSRRLAARSIKMIHVITENAEIFSRQVALKFGSSRYGDQYGFLLAGAYSLESDNVIEDVEAYEYINSYDWSAYAEPLEDLAEERALQAILESRIQIDGNESRETLSMGELISRVVERRATINLDTESIKRFLADFGIKHHEEMVCFANRAGNLDALLKDSPYAVGWRKYLGQIEGAYKSEKPIWFSAALKSQRFTGLPESMFYGEQ